MSELLRKANELMEARRNAGQGEWKQDGFHVDQEKGNYVQFDIAFEGDIEFIVLAANNAVDIIKGYQRLLKAALMLIQHANFIPYKELETVANLWITEAKAAIPEEPNND